VLAQANDSLILTTEYHARPSVGHGCI